MNTDNDTTLEGGCTCRVALSNDDQTVVRALLSLPLVST